MALFGTRGFELCTGRGKAARAEFYDRVGERPRYIADRGQAQRGSSHTARNNRSSDPIAGLESRVNQSHPVEPVRKRMAHALDSRDVTVNLESSGRQKQTLTDHSSRLSGFILHPYQQHPVAAAQVASIVFLLYPFTGGAPWHHRTKPLTIPSICRPRDRRNAIRRNWTKCLTKRSKTA